MDKFKYIPNYSNYGITDDGRIYHLVKKKWLGESNRSGYKSIKMKDDFGNIVNTQCHRVVCMAFHGMPPPDKCYVNHKDGNKNNNHPDNLEWVSPKENVEHAGEMKLSPKCLPCSIRNYSTKQILHFPSAKEMSLYLKISKYACLYRLLNKENRVFPDGNQYRYRDDSRPWIEPTIFSFGRTRKVAVFDIKNKLTFKFPNQGKAAEFIKCSEATLSNLLNDSSQPVCINRYLVQYDVVGLVWREVEDLLLENKSRKPVIVMDKDGNKTIYESTKKCSEAMNIKMTTLNWRLKSNGDIVYNDGFRYMYY